ncbi:MAG: penicillin-binding protein 2 [Patescibacteria group bacterium]
MNLGRWHHNQTTNTRINTLQRVIFFFVLIIIGRLFYLQIIQNKQYVKLGAEQRAIEQEVKPERGRILALTDASTSDQLYPLAVNRVYYEVALDPAKITRPQNITDIVAPILGIDAQLVLDKSNQTDKRYEVLAKAVTEEKVAAIKNKLEILLADVNKNRAKKDVLTRLEDLGVIFTKNVLRYYPDKEVGAHVLGFLGYDEQGLNRVGKYGLEGYFDKDLSGQIGMIIGEKDVSGILLTAGQAEDVVNGADVVLTIDHTVQYKACKMLEKAVLKNMADNGTLIIMESNTGAIRAMCNYPSFDPNEYNKVDSIDVYNNIAVYQAYEPGSVMKAVAMAIAVDQGKVSPNTAYEDKGEVKFAGGQVIRNAGDKIYGWSDMKKVLTYSINTGIIFATQDVPNKVFAEYMENFGFGKLTGLSISQEMGGDISSLSKRGDIFKATASYGQGITATPLQMLNAINVIANRGNLMQPYIINEIRYNDKVLQKTEPKILHRGVISANTASQVSAMMVNVVDGEHAVAARVPGYYVAGKSGTAQVANSQTGKYDNSRTIHSFIGFAPQDNPKFTMLVKLDNPKTAQYSEGTAIPLFGEIAKFLLEYYQVPPSR